MSDPPIPLAAIDIGPSRAVEVAGYTLHLDTIAAAVAAGAIVVAVGLLVRRRASATAPTRAQLAWEVALDTVDRLGGPTTGASTRRIAPVAVTLFVYILTANLLEIIPSGHPDKALPAPTGDLNLTVALALVAIALVHLSAIRELGVRRYLHHYLRPSPWFLPLKVLEELTRPVTLALRLFGNVLAGTVVVLLIFELVPVYLAPLPLFTWKLFSVFVAAMQAFLFALLTTLYYQAAVGDSTGPPPSPTRPPTLQRSTP